MAKHHIIPLHEWKRRINPKATRRDLNFNAPDNYVWLTTEQHAQVHQLLFELYQNEFDRIAYQTISGQIGKEEATRLAGIVAHTGTKHSAKTRALMSLSRTGLKHPPEFGAAITLRQTGTKHSLERCAAISAAKKGKPLPALNCAAMYAARGKRGPYKKRTT